MGDKYFALGNVGKDTLGFIHGTFFELMICSTCSMAMLQYSDSFTGSDIFSVVLQFMCAAMLVIYVVYVTYFTISKAGLWS